MVPACSAMASMGLLEMAMPRPVANPRKTTSVRALGRVDVAALRTAVLALPGTHLHLYGKLSARPGRKMGHLTVTGATVDQVRATAAQVAAVLGLPSP